MKQETTDKFLGIQRHQLYLIAVGVIAPAKRNLSIFQR